MIYIGASYTPAKFHMSIFNGCNAIVAQRNKRAKKQTLY